MAVKAIAYSYWRAIKRGTKDFQKDIVKSSKASVKAVADDIRYLAAQDVINGEITAEQYAEYLGEEYVAE